jgi:hypothetical protein
MTNFCKTAWPTRTSRVAAGLATAWLLAGCGGGGGGGGGNPTPNPPASAQTVAGPTLVPAGNASTVAIGNAQPGAGQTPEVDVLTNAAPAGGVTITIKTDPSAPSVPSSFIKDSTIYDIEPAGTQFLNGGITIDIPYTAPTGGAGVTQIYYYDSGTSSWQPVSGSDITNSGDTVISVTTNQIQLGRNNGGAPTDYAVLSPTLTGPPTAPPPP